MDNPNDFLKGAKVTTGHQLICDGQIRGKQRPVQVSYRLPEDQVNWIRQNMPKSANYGVSKLLEYAIDHVKKELANGDFDIDSMHAS